MDLGAKCALIYVTLKNVLVPSLLSTVTESKEFMVRKILFMLQVGFSPPTQIMRFLSL